MGFHALQQKVVADTHCVVAIIDGRTHSLVGIDSGPIHLFALVIDLKVLRHERILCREGFKSR